MWQKNWGNLCRKIKLHQSWWEPAGRKKCLEEKFLLSGHEKKEGRLRSRSTTLIGDLSEFFANFCINSFPRTFADTQQSLTSQSRFASNTSSSSISHTRETAFFLNIRGQVDTYIFASVFFPLIQILTKTAEMIQKMGECKTQTLQELTLKVG